MASQSLKIHQLQVNVDGKNVLNGVDLVLEQGSIGVIMGKNGSGKSSLALTLMGHPRYEVSNGTITFAEHDITDLSPDERARCGMFLAMQHPLEIEGVPYKDFLRQAYNSLYDGTERQLRIRDFHKMLLDRMALLDIDESFINRSLNVGFSGGEKKRAEILQLAVLKPQLAILDEIDSGLDVDALRIVCKGLAAVKAENPNMTILLITHYPRILQYLQPDVVFVMDGGKVIRTGDASLAHEIEQHGFQD